MPNTYDYAILRLIPDASRGESVNVGLVVFGPDGIDVRLTPILQKARALSAWVDVEHLRQLQEAIPAALNKIADRELQLFTLRSLFQPVTIDDDIGRFVVGISHEYEARITETMAAFVLPEPRTRRAAGQIVNRLHSDLKEWFRRHQLLGLNAEALHKHKIVTNYPIAPTAGIYAEFALKNGVYRITETIDFRVKDVDSRKSNEAAAKAMTLMEAKAALGTDTQRFAILAATDYAKIQAQINLLSRHADHVLMRDSAEDMDFYAKTVAKAAKVPELAWQ